jgi:hypothetical protein
LIPELYHQAPLRSGQGLSSGKYPLRYQKMLYQAHYSAAEDALKFHQGIFSAEADVILLCLVSLH